MTQPLGLGEITVVLRSPEYSPAEKAMAQQQLDAMTPGAEPAAEPAPEPPAAAPATAGGPREALARSREAVRSGAALPGPGERRTRHRMEPRDLPHRIRRRRSGIIPLTPRRQANKVRRHRLGVLR